MAIYGNFTYKADTDTFKGRIALPGFAANAQLVPNEDKKGDTHPDYLLLSEGSMIGAGWSNIAKSSKKEYVSVKIDVPQLPAPVYCNLNESKEVEGQYILIWTR